MGRGRSIKSPKIMAEKWEEYKEYCNTRTFVVNEFSQKLGDFVTKKLIKPTTCTIAGFCDKFLDMTEQNFYATYNNDPKFESVIARMKQYCEIDAREKFESGLINPRLAGLWMSNYGYCLNKADDEKQSNNITFQFVKSSEVKDETNSD